MKSLRESGEVLKKFRVAYFGISSDSIKKNTKFAESLELDFPILSDEDKTVAKAYGVLGKWIKFPKRQTFFIGKEGTILFIDTKVSTKKHGEGIAKKLGELGVEKRP